MEEEESFWLFLSLSPAPVCAGSEGHGLIRCSQAMCILSALLPVTRSGVQSASLVSEHLLPVHPLQADCWSLQIKQFRGKFTF